MPYRRRMMMLNSDLLGMVTTCSVGRQKERCQCLSMPVTVFFGIHLPLYASWQIEKSGEYYDGVFATDLREW